MSATVGELVVNLVARTAAFNTGLRESSQNVANFSQRVTGMAGTLKSALGAVGVGISVGGIASWIKGNMELIDQVGELSQRTKISTDSLMGFFHAAQLVGSSQEQLTAGIEKMLRTLGEAKAGAGEAAKAFQRLGLNVAELSRGGPQEAMLRIADAIKKIGDPAEKAAAATAIFGRGGQDLINFLDLGREGIQGMIEDAKRLGLTFSEETAKGVGKACDELDRLKAAMKGLGIEAGAAAAAPAEQTAAGLTGYMQQRRELEKQIAALGEQTGMGGLLGLMIPTGVREGMALYLSMEARDIEGMRARAAAAAPAPPPPPESGPTGRMSAEMARRQGAMEAAFGAQMEKDAETFAEGVRQRQQHVAQLIRQQLTVRGGDGAELAPLATMGSLAAYQALARQGMQPTAQRTNEDILKTVREQLEEEKKLNVKVAELVGKITGSETVEIR